MGLRFQILGFGFWKLETPSDYRLLDRTRTQPGVADPGCVQEERRSVDFVQERSSALVLFHTRLQRQQFGFDSPAG